MSFCNAIACTIRISACAHASVPPEPPVDPEATVGPEINDARFHADLLSVAKGYEWMHRADGVWWSPVSCAGPPPNPAWMSRASSGRHGRKLYTVFVEDYEVYVGRPSKRVKPVAAEPPPDAAGATGPSTAPAAVESRVALRIGPDFDRFPQVVVKEAWTPIRSEDHAANCPNTGMHYLVPVMANGVQYKACQPASLFVIYRVPDGADTEGTDDGWVYGTVQDDGRVPGAPGESRPAPVVTSAGRVASCMRCHARAPMGRLFGPRRSR